MIVRLPNAIVAVATSQEPATSSVHVPIAVPSTRTVTVPEAVVASTEATPTVRVTSWPKAAGWAEDEMATAVVALTTWTTSPETLGANSWSPLYCAATRCVPGRSVLSVSAQEARVADAWVSAQEPIEPPVESMKSTVPVGAAVELSTLAVKVTAVPAVTTEALVAMVVATPPDTVVPLRVVRDREEKTLNVKVGELDLTAEQASRDTQRGGDPTQEPTSGFGMSLSNITPDVARRLRLDDDVLIEIANDDVFFASRRGERMLEHLDDLAVFDPATFVASQVAVDHDAPRAGVALHELPVDEAGDVEAREEDLDRQEHLRRRVRAGDDLALGVDGVGVVS